MQPIVKAENLKKNYALGKVTVEAVRGISFDVQKGEFAAIIGPSGCGKSTLMHLVGCLDRPTSGKIYIDGTDVSTLSDNELAAIRNKKIGFVFQAYNLLPRLNAIENIELPLIYMGIPAPQRKKMAEAALDHVGLKDRALHRPPEMSGGQSQRVAIARALVVTPAIILADEPTGNLDTQSSNEIMAIFQRLNEEGVSIIMVTHEVDVAKASQRIIQIRDGQILSDEKISQSKKH
ncbi:MAG: ABC transporter ATP-binding protein [Candidatus Margulisiibacteriota bacterium]